MNGPETLLNQEEPLLTDGLTNEEDRELARLLSKWNGDRVSTSVFTELARKIPLSIIEVVLFRKNANVLETLLIPRPEGDIVWPGMFNTPGTALRREDFCREDQNPLNGPFERIQRGELNTNFAYTPIFVGRLYRLEDRGPEVVEVYFTELPEESCRLNHIWYPIDKLAENPKFIQSQLEHVTLAAKKYRKK